MSTYQIDARVAGIPCKIEVASNGWRLMDRRGRHAPWLERKLQQGGWEYRAALTQQIEDQIADEKFSLF